MKPVRVAAGRRVAAGHLWIFSNEVRDNLGSYEAGELVEVTDEKSGFLGTGYINPRSLIAVRLLSRDRRPIDGAFFAGRLADAIAARREAGYDRFDACRLVFGESDGLPGLVVDRYGDVLSVQVLTAGMERLYPVARETLLSMLRPRAVVLRNTSSFRELEGLPLETAVDFGAVGDDPVVSEDGISFAVDVTGGQKTGFFLDQRENRLALRSLLNGRPALSALDCFSYAGGWGLNIARAAAGSRVTCVDISERAVALVRANAVRNGLSCDAVRADAFTYLKDAAAGGGKFDCVVLDPPAFIKSRTKVREGMKGYREINVRAMKLLAPGGLLVTASCSHHLGADEFLLLLSACAADTGRRFSVIRAGGQAKDHPVLLAMPESAYLKTFFLRLLPF